MFFGRVAMWARPELFEPEMWFISSDLFPVFINIPGNAERKVGIWKEFK